MPRLGYACINMELREQNIYTSRTVILARIRDVEHLRAISADNVADLARIIEWNEQRGIRFFRVTSSLFPHMDNPRLPSPQRYDISHVKPQLAAIGKRARGLGHPGQFVQLGAQRDDVLAQSILELTAHADVLSAMGMEPEHDNTRRRSIRQ